MMSDIDFTPFDDETDDDAFPMIPALLIPERMLTRKRLSWLFEFTGQVLLQVVIDDDSGDVAFGIGLPASVFDSMSDAELAEMGLMFRGIDDVAYHPRLLFALKRSLN